MKSSGLQCIASTSPSPEVLHKLCVAIELAAVAADSHKDGCQLKRAYSAPTVSRNVGSGGRPAGRREPQSESSRLAEKRRRSADGASGQRVLGEPAAATASTRSAAAAGGARQRPTFFVRVRVHEFDNGRRTAHITFRCGRRPLARHATLLSSAMEAVAVRHSSAGDSSLRVKQSAACNLFCLYPSSTAVRWVTHGSYCQGVLGWQLG